MNRFQIDAVATRFYGHLAPSSRSLMRLGLALLPAWRVRRVPFSQEASWNAI